MDEINEEYTANSGHQYNFLLDSETANNPLLTNAARSSCLEITVLAVSLQLPFFRPRLLNYTFRPSTTSSLDILNSTVSFLVV